jgi:hypothetical protein
VKWRPVWDELVELSIDKRSSGRLWQEDLSAGSRRTSTVLETVAVARKWLVDTVID